MEELDNAIKVVEDFIDLFSNLSKNLNYNEDKVQYFHDKEQDFNHALELDDLGYHEIGKLAKQHKLDRIERRKYKDLTEWQGDLYLLFQDKPQLNQAVNLMRNHLGSMRKAKERQTNRFYTPRIRKDEE